MKKYFISVLSILFLISAAVFLFISSSNSSQKNSETKIAATIFPIYDIARQIAQDKVKVELILPSGASPHTFEFSPQQIKNLQNVKLIFYVNYKADDWILKIKEILPEVKLVKVDHNIKLKKFGQNNSFDPHYWLSVNNAKIISQTITENLIKIDPQNENFYQKNNQDYQKKLSDLDEYIHKQLKEIKNRNFIATHKAWAYFCADYNLNLAAVFSSSPGKEPTSQDLIKLNNVIKKYKIKVIFTEPQLAKDFIKPLASDLGLKIYLLDPLGGEVGRDSYISLMKFNVDQLKQGLSL